MSGREGISPPNGNTPADNPYIPASAMGVPGFLARHPTYDGRGAVVAILDTSIDLLSPVLQTGKSLDGRAAPKFVDVLTAVPSVIDPSDDDGSLSTYRLVDMHAEIAADAAVVMHNGARYVLPANGPTNGRYRFGRFSEREGSAEGDLNRDGNPPASDGAFAVLWDDGTNTVWVDTNQNQSFADEQPLTDYRVRHDIGVFGRDDPGTDLRETVGFAVQTDPRHRLVVIIPGYGVHGTGVTGGAFGSGFFGGGLHGIAPGARIVSVPFGPGIHGIIESVITAARHPQVDIVTLQHVLSGPANDGRSTLSIVCDRLVERFNKPIFSSAGNAGDEVAIVQESASGDRVIAVGSYISRETSRVNYGLVPARTDNIDIASARGPRRDGGFKPNVLAPTKSLSACPGFLAREAHNGGAYPLSPGYCIYGGTSSAAPMAAAAAALLVGGAKQSAVRFDADLLRWALMSSARFLPGYGAYEQGAGLIQVPAAWEALRSAPRLPEIRSSTLPDAIGRWGLGRSHAGGSHAGAGRYAGLYEREGWTAGQRGMREIVLLRSTGSRSAASYKVRWVGNDGTFSSRATMVLPLDRSTVLPVSIQPKTAGVHSALLQLVGSDNRAHYQSMATIVAAERFKEQKQCRLAYRAQVNWMDSMSYYFFVPENASALHVDVHIERGYLRPLLMLPSGTAFWAASPRPFTDYQAPGPWNRTVSHPQPGVWQLVIDNKADTNEVRSHTGSPALFAALLTVAGCGGPQ